MIEVGDHVIIVGPSDTGSREVDLIGFNDNMKGLIGSEATVESESSYRELRTFYLDIDPMKWTWAESWLSPTRDSGMESADDSEVAALLGLSGGGS